MFKITRQIASFLLLFLIPASPFLFLAIVTLEETYFLSIAILAAISCFTLWAMISAIMIDVKKWGRNK